MVSFEAFPMLRLTVCCSMPQRTTRPTITVRPYQPQADHAAVLDICRNVCKFIASASAVAATVLAHSY